MWKANWWRRFWRDLALNKQGFMNAPILTRFTVCLWAVLLAVSSAVGASHVTINADGALVIDGRKVFPIGFTMPPPPDGKAPDGRNGIQALHDAGATFLR